MDSGAMTLYRECKPIVDANFREDGSSSPAEAIVHAVAEAADVDPVELAPLYESIDPDAIDALFQDHAGTVDSEATLGFRIDHWNIFVRGDGRIRVCDGTQPTPPQPVFESVPA